MIYLTDKAIEMIRAGLEKRKTPNACVRIGIKGAGACSGYSYHMQFEDNPPKENDIKLFYNGIRVLVDPKSMLLLDGTTLNWKEKLMERGFKFEKNPNEKSSCGCGKSFAI